MTQINADIKDPETYAVNGAAKNRGYLPIESIWKIDPEVVNLKKMIAKTEGKTVEEVDKVVGPTPRISIGSILNAGLRLCQ